MEDKSQIQYRKDEAEMVESFEMLINNGKYYIYDENLPPKTCLLYTSPSPRDRQKSRMPSSA